MTAKRILCAAVLAGWALSTPCRSGASDAPRDAVFHDVPRLTKPIKVDGKLDEPFYGEARPLTNFLVEFKPEPILANRQTKVWAGYDERALYLGMRLEEPFVDQLRGNCRDHDGSIWWDDGVEVYLEPGCTHTRSFIFAVNAAGTRGDRFAGPTPLGWQIDSSWGLGATWQAAVGRGDKAWTIEMEIPYADLGVPAPAAGSVWSFQVRRFAYAGTTWETKEYSHWSFGGAYNNPDRFGHICFEGHMAAVEDLLHNKLAPIIGTSVRIPSSAGELSYSDYPTLRTSLRREAATALDETSEMLSLAEPLLDQASAKKLADRLGELRKAVPDESAAPATAIAALRKIVSSCQDIRWEIRVASLIRKFDAAAQPPQDPAASGQKQK